MINEDEEDVMPSRSTPTGAPNMGVIQLPSEAILRSLQVKAELSKLGVPPRAYVEKIASVPHSEDSAMIIEEGNDSIDRLTLT